MPCMTPVASIGRDRYCKDKRIISTHEAGKSESLDNVNRVLEKHSLAKLGKRNFEMFNICYRD